MWTDSLHSTSKAALAALPTRDVPRGSVMFRPGDVAQGFVVVLSGRIEVD
jgi:CRP/FNR family transcriptional regulator, anaerobic regulatory protein